MDTGLLNNFAGEHFSTFDPFDEMGPEDSLGIEEWENERELNGDIGLIPVSSSFCQSLKDMTESPPSDIFQKMIEDWPIEVMGSGPLQPHSDDNIYNFDITSFINEALPPGPPPTPKIKAAVKKIDLSAQKYIVEDDLVKEEPEDLIDVETVLDDDIQPVLEAFDPYSLLEQFEASERPNLKAPIDIFADKVDPPADKLHPVAVKVELPTVNVDLPAVKVELPVVKLEKKPEEVRHRKETDVMTTGAPKPYKNKQIIEALPQELIARINESGKRKPITVIPPIPNKKRARVSATNVNDVPNKKTLMISSISKVRLDHDYCTSSPSSSSSPYPKDPKKDSGFESAEEDSERNLIRNQPMIKTADGKLMVSLLKVNTIRNATVATSPTSNDSDCNGNKKKLNLEEYKKRRFIKSERTSQNTSPMSSTCSSPLPEDETVKRLKHQEKLMKMAADLLNTPPKKDVNVKQELEVAVEKRKARDFVPPADIEMKTLVSVATNTAISSNEDSSFERLAEIEPLLKKVSDRINPNSFITELIENIPKVKCKKRDSSTSITTEDQVIRENKVVLFLKKDRPAVKSCSVGVQTSISLVAEDTQQSRYRRRNDSSSSESSSSDSSSSSSGSLDGYRRSGRRKRRSAGSSSSSISSRSSRGSSRSVSPKRSRYLSAERLREVEERRVIYVGRIAAETTKDDLRRRFRQFGTIINISLHFREYGDNYGFVTFANKEDAYEAVEHGNDGFVHPKFDLSFGGRRIFCKTTYSDLDNMRDDDYNYYNNRGGEVDDSFDALLRAAQEKLRNRKP